MSVGGMGEEEIQAEIKREKEGEMQEGIEKWGMVVC